MIYGYHTTRGYLMCSNIRTPY